MNKHVKIFWCFSLILHIVSCTATPTPPPTIKEASSDNPTNDNFTPSSMNKIPPNDILEEVTWFPGAGPGDDGSSICSDTNKYPTIKYDPFDVELMNSSGMTTCGWQSNHELEVSIIFPNGKVQQEIIHADEDGMAEASIRPDNSDPEGVYEFIISDGVTVLKSNAYFRKPIVPRMHYFSENTIRFYNFPASEPIRLFLYKCTYRIEDLWCTKWKFVGWQEYQISANGDLEVKVTETKDVYYIAVTTSGIEIRLSEDPLPTTIFGENSKFYESTDNYWKKSQEYLLCPENAPSPSNDSEWGQIVNAGGEGINLYSRPRASARVVEKLQNGRILSFSRYPKCNGGNIFWEVNLLDNQFKYDGYGYVSLADFDGNYYFKPIILNEGNKTECGLMTSYLSVGDRGKVVSSDSSSLRLRDKPGVDQKIMGLLPEGTPFLVLDGLECIDNIAWWKIHTNTGLEGWAAEYYDNKYLLTLIDARACFGVQEPSRLSIGDMAEIATDDGTALRVRSRPGIQDSDILFSIPNGVQVSIVEGPICSWEGDIWWRIVTKGGNTGWMLEYQNNVYYLKPVH